MLLNYVHTHWSYRHPYAARTWTESDWRGFVQGIRNLGFDTVMLWPLLDCMPAEPNASDRAFLERVGRVIRFIRNDFGMRVFITAGPNAIGNERSAEFAFEDRPYFHCDARVNPRDPEAVRAFLAGRQRQLSLIGPTDGLVVIDSDPGGWPGSRNAEFVDLAVAQAGLMRELNPQAHFFYWMWLGWEVINHMWASDRPTDGAAPPRPTPLAVFSETLELMRQRMPEPWGLFATMPEHMTATENTGLVAKRLYNPYGLVEGEPSFPITNCTPAAIRDRFAAEYTPERFPLGLMANAQTHAMQLPNTYLFAHFAQGGTEAGIDLPGFAARLLPAAADAIAAAWQALADGRPDLQHAAAEKLRPAVGRPHCVGDCGGLLFGDADRFLVDLIHSLEIHAALTEFERDPQRERLRSLVPTVRAHLVRTGFVDAYYDDRLFAAINKLVGRFADPGVDAALKNFRSWTEPVRHHGAIAKLLDALEAFASGA